MRKFTFLALLVTLLVGCGARGVERKATAIANENVKAIAGAMLALEHIKNSIPFGELLLNQTEVMDAVLDLEPEEKLEFQPTVDEKKLTSGDPQDLQEEVEKSDKDTEETKEEVDEAQAAGFWGWMKDIFTWGGWGAVGLGLAWAVHVAADAFPALKPLKLVTGPILNRVPLVGGALKGQEKLKVAAATVESSTVGRYALKAADKKLAKTKYADEITKVIGAITGGQESTIEGLFTHWSKGHAVDHSEIAHEDVRALLEEVKTKMPTEGGLPAEVAPLLKEADVGT